MKKNNKKGFTLAELLIVVAIIAVLTAIAIPVFSAQLNKSKAATDEANARSLYAQLVADYLDDNKYNDGGTVVDSLTISPSGTTTYGNNTYTWSNVLESGTVTLDTANGPSVRITTNNNTITFPKTSGSGA